MFRHSFVRVTHRFLREGSSTKTQMCVAVHSQMFGRERGIEARIKTLCGVEKTIRTVNAVVAW